MSTDDEFSFLVRPGRIRSKGAQYDRPFIAQVMAAVRKAGGHVSRSGQITSGTRSSFGRGRQASVMANRFITSRSRRVVVQARVVRHTARSAPLKTHLDYLRREGVTRDGEKAQLFGPGDDAINAKDFAERCRDDRHHFRFIVSPEDAMELSDLKAYARDLVGQMEKDLDTELDWVGVTHWNTGHPHAHIIVRGRTNDGQDLVISRDYIREGMRGRASELATLELGQRTDHDINQALRHQVDAERWTPLDRQLQHDETRSGIIDMAPHPDRQPDEYHVFKIGRLQKLESLGLAVQLSPGQWIVKEHAEQTLRDLGERNDIIKRLHRGLTEHGLERSTASYVLAGENLETPIVGRLLERGLDDELKGTAYAVVDGVDGRTHHIKLSSLDAASDSPPGSIVELRAFDDAKGNRRVALAVRSDLSIEKQVTADGATWLDRQALSKEPVDLGDGFGQEVRAAMEQRVDHLVEQGLATRQGQRVIFSRNLLDTLCRRELDALGKKLAAETGKAFNAAAEGEYVTGTYRQQFRLASGRYAMIDDGLGFQLVPWTPSLEKQIERHVSGVARANGGVDWDFGKKRGIGL